MICRICRTNDADPRDKRHICSSQECLDGYNARQRNYSSNSRALKRRKTPVIVQIAPITSSITSSLDSDAQQRKLDRRDERARRYLQDLQERLAKANHG